MNKFLDDCIMDHATSVKKTFTTDSKKMAKSTAPLTTLEPGTIAFSAIIETACHHVGRVFEYGMIIILNCQFSCTYIIILYVYCSKRVEPPPVVPMLYPEIQPKPGSAVLKAFLLAS